MQKNALSGLIAAVLALGAAGVNHALPRIQPARLRVVAVEQLPRDIGAWHGGANQPVDEHTRQVLTHSQFLVRDYSTVSGGAVRAGQSGVNLLLQSSPESGEYHTPTACLPTQGWTINKTETTQIGVPGRTISATEMWMEQGTQKAAVLYWYTGEKYLDKWQSLVGAITGDRQKTRLFARLLVPVTGSYEDASQRLHEFGASLTPYLAELEKNTK